MIKREVKLAPVHHLKPWQQLQPGLAPRSPQDTPRLDLELLQQYSVLGEAVRLPQTCSFGPKGSHLSPKMTCISALDQIICRGCRLIVDSLMAIWCSMSNFKGFAQNRPWGTRTKRPLWSPCVVNSLGSTVALNWHCPAGRRVFFSEKASKKDLDVSPWWKITPRTTRIDSDARAAHTSSLSVHLTKSHGLLLLKFLSRSWSLLSELI